MGIFINTNQSNITFNDLDDILTEGFIQDAFQKVITVIKELLANIKKWFLDMIERIKKNNKGKINKEEFKKNLASLTGPFEYETYNWDPKHGMETFMEIVEDLEHVRAMVKEKFDQNLSDKKYDSSFIDDADDYLFNKKIETIDDIIKRLNTSYGKVKKHTLTKIEDINKLLEYIDDVDYIEIMANIGTKALAKIESDLNSFISEINRLKSEYEKDSESAESKKALKFISEYSKYYTMVISRKRVALQTSFSLHNEIRHVCDVIIHNVNTHAKQTKAEE